MTIQNDPADCVDIWVRPSAIPEAYSMEPALVVDMWPTDPDVFLVDRGEPATANLPVDMPSHLVFPRATDERGGLRAAGPACGALLAVALTLLVSTRHRRHRRRRATMIGSEAIPA